MSDDEDPLSRWTRIGNKAHGYAGIFNSETSDDKRIVERCTLEEWRKSIAIEYGIEIGEPEYNPNDPPDFFVRMGDQRLGIELVQLIEQKHKERASVNETPFEGQLFEDMQWSESRFISKLNQLVTKKGIKYAKTGIQIDVLLIHTDETWLTSIQAQEWLKHAKISLHPNISNVSLLFFYEPGRGVKHWAVLPVYGDMFEKRRSF